jgi:hypothetical protein
MSSPIHVLVIGFVALVHPVAQGAVTVYTDRNLWAAAAGIVTIESFESVPLGSISRIEGPLGSVRFYVSGPEPPATDLRPAIESSGAINGSREFVGNLYGATPRVLGPTSYTFLFSSSINAWGANFASAASAGSLLVDFKGDTVSVEDGIGAPGTGFVGFISTQASDRIDFRLRNPTNTEFFQMDNMAFAVVPEPAAATLLGLGALTWVGRRRRRINQRTTMRLSAP